MFPIRSIPSCGELSSCARYDKGAYLFDFFFFFLLNRNFLKSMDNLERTCASLRTQIAATETQLVGLRRELESAEKAAIDIKRQDADRAKEDRAGEKRQWPLLNEEYRRYGRQMIVAQLGLQGG